MPLLLFIFVLFLLLCGFSCAAPASARFGPLPATSKANAQTTAPTSLAVPAPVSTGGVYCEADRPLYPSGALFAEGDRIVLQCGTRLLLREADTRGHTHIYRALPGATPTADLALLAASEDGTRVIAAAHDRRALYLWQEGSFARVALRDGGEVLCADARSRVAVYAAAQKIFVIDLGGSSRAETELGVAPEVAVAARSNTRGCAIEGERVLFAAATPWAAELWNYRTRQRERREKLEHPEAHVEELRLFGSRYGFVECHEDRTVDRCRPRAFTLSSASPGEVVSVNDLNRVREASAFEWIRDGSKLFVVPPQARGGVLHRSAGSRSFDRTSVYDRNEELVYYESDLRVRSDGKFALMRFDAPPTGNTPPPRHYLYDLAPNERATPLRCPTDSPNDMNATLGSPE